MKKNKNFQSDIENYTWCWTTHYKKVYSSLDGDVMKVIRYDDMKVYD